MSLRTLLKIFHNGKNFIPIRSACKQKIELAYQPTFARNTNHSLTLQQNAPLKYKSTVYGNGDIPDIFANLNDEVEIECICRWWLYCDNDQEVKLQRSPVINSIYLSIDQLKKNSIKIFSTIRDDMHYVYVPAKHWLTYRPFLTMKITNFFCSSDNFCENEWQLITEEV
mgnify:CR=1 FL=1